MHYGGVHMKEYDMIVIGSGSAMTVVEEALAHQKTVALVDRGPVGGTCLNLGCIPSKMLIASADRVMEIRESDRVGISASIGNIDFQRIMDEMRDHINLQQQSLHRALTSADEFDFYEGEGHFVDDYTIEVDGQRIKGKQIVIGAGSRPWAPSIDGLDSVQYLTNETALELDELPSSMIILGGGYIAVEFAHFFAAMGTQVTIIEKEEGLVRGTEPEISELLQRKLSERMAVFTGADVQEAWEEGDEIHVKVQKDDTFVLQAQKLMVATGRQSNADILDVAKTGVIVDERGFIQTNEYLETNKEGIYAIGDVNGKSMFMHAANEQAVIASHNALHGHRISFDHSGVPYAIFSWPQVAAVGLGEREAREKHDVLTGTVQYDETAKGNALREHDGFAKAIVKKDDLSLLGFHIVGPYAPILIQEAINAMRSEGGARDLVNAMHIHPALSELVQRAVANVQ